MKVCAACKSVVALEASFCPHCGSAIAKAKITIGPGAELELEDWGRVVLGHVIGEGGMGVVYRAWIYYNPAGRFAGASPHPIAVKLLHPLLQGRSRARKLFVREATALARLSHPNIVHFFGLSDFNGQLALVMELVHGEPLDDLLLRVRTESRGGPLPALPLAQAWHYFAQLLGALASIHAFGILHRDVKSANLLVRGDGVVKLTDFGIARIPEEEALTTGGMAPGTGAYMSPEQVLNKPLDPRSDLYAAAIVLYEMLTGVTPFDAPDRSEIMVRAAQVEEAPQPLGQRLSGTPPVLDLLMARALAKDPALRYGSAIELGETFRDALGLPESPGWRLQQQLAEVAKTMSEVEMPAAHLGEHATAVGAQVVLAFRK